jgi:sortase A
MLLNPRNAASAILLAGLFLLTSGFNSADLISPAPGNIQAALPALAPASTSAILLATQTPQTPSPPPNATEAGVSDQTSRILETPEVLPPFNHSQNAIDNAQPAEDRTPTRLVIPAIGLDAPVDPVGWHVETDNGRPANVWDAPDYFAAGWLKTSAPLGMPGNTVLDGHNNISGEVFRTLNNIQVGDTITLYAANQERVYRVDQKLILKEIGQPLEVRQANAQYISPTADERLTLVTCWPPTGNSHRLIIVAQPVAPPAVMKSAKHRHE